MKTKNDIIIPQECYEILKMIADSVGIDLDNYDYHKNNLSTRLIKRMRALNLTDLKSYCNRVIKSKEEEQIFINLLTNITTSFFREPHHFDYLSKIYFPTLIKMKKRIRIWSAGCSTGEEPYSIAMSLLEAYPKLLENYDVKILATDINSNALKIAEDGIYDAARIEKLSIQSKSLWFHKIENSNFYKIDDRIKSLVHFKSFDLTSTLWPMHGPFDTIFCRNVIIYFKTNVRRHIMEKFCPLIAENGLLILGHSETLDNLYDRFKSVDITTYQKLR